ncbi:MAG: phosphotransferase [Alphaproteobacteria bacterium]
MKVFEDKYKILKSLGHGTSSHGYLVENALKEKFVIKTPAMESIDAWEQEGEKEISVLEPLHHLKNHHYILPLSVLEKSEDGEQYMLSTLVRGEALSEKAYQSMDIVEKKNLAQSLAQFMSDLHSSILPSENNENSNLEQFFNDKNVKRKIDKVSRLMPKHISEKMSGIFSEFESDNNLFKYETMCHNDLVKGNLLYDKDSKKLGVIDFGDVDRNEIYADFGNLMRLGQLPDEFGVSVIKEYNSLQKEKGRKVQIDAHTAKRYAILRSFKALKKLDNMSDTEKKIEILKFDNYLKQYEKNKSEGIYVTKVKPCLSKDKGLQR